MDDFALKGELLRDTLDKLGQINKWLGGNKITLDGVEQLLKNQPKDKTYAILDLGCGHGDILRQIAQYGRRNGYKFQLLGIDANNDAIDYARDLSVDYPELSFVVDDVFRLGFPEQSYHIVLSTLFLHHFDDIRSVKLIDKLTKNASLGIVVNDLHRSPIAYSLFKILGFFISNEMIKKDGLTSILRAFKRKDLVNMSELLGLNASINWRWAFRYQWLIKT